MIFDLIREVYEEEGLMSAITCVIVMVASFLYAALTVVGVVKAIIDLSTH